MEDGDRPPLHGVSHRGDDNGALCLIFALSWASITGLALASRFVIALNRRLRIELDDTSFAVAALLAIVSSAFYVVAVDAGLGRHMASLEPSSITRYFKALYAAQLTGIAAIGFSKLSVVFLSKRSELQVPAWTWWTAFSVVPIWTVVSLLIYAFQCRLPEPWRFHPTNCPSRGSLQYLVTAFIILTDLFITALAVVPVWRLNMLRLHRIVVAGLFSLRLIISGVAISQIVALAKSLLSSDQSWAGVLRVLFDMAIVHLSVIHATLPRISRALYYPRDNLAVPRISNFEFARYHSDVAEQNRGSVLSSTEQQKSQDAKMPIWASDPNDRTTWSTRSEQEPWTRRRDCAYVEAFVMANANEDVESELDETSRGYGIEVARSFKVRVGSK